MNWIKNIAYGRTTYKLGDYIIVDGYGHLPSELICLTDKTIRLKFNSVDEAKEYVEKIKVDI